MMQETLANHADSLNALLVDLRARGVTFVLKGNALKIRPWKTLTTDEAATVQANRPALKALVRAERNARSVKNAPAPEPLCAYCGNRKCVGADHHAYAVLHALDPIEVKKRTEHATQVMYRMARFGHPNY